MTNWIINEAVEYYKGQDAPQNQFALVELLKEVQEHSGGVLTVSNARQGACITVCSVDGKAVSRCTAGGASVDIPLPGDGIYIVNVDGKTYKLASQAMKN